MSTGSLVVKISADINSFSREMNKMTKDVDKASKKITEIGKAISLGITLPVGLAAVALGKMAIENEAVAGKLQRSFGPAVENIHGLITKLMQVVPETATELERIAIGANDFARGLGMAAPKAELLTEQMLKMAADISSRKMIDFNDALEIVQKGMSGQTRGLKEVGIVIDKTQIKQEAYRLGLLKVGQELNPLGTALATYSLMTKQLGQVQGDANASWNDTGRQLAFAKRDLLEFFDATSNLMIPAIRLLASVLKGVVDVLNELPDWVRQTIMVFGGLLAVLGPSIIVLAKLAQAFTTLRAAMLLASESSGIMTFLMALTAPEILAGLAAIAIVIGGIIALWKKFHKEVKTDPPKIDAPIDVSKLLGGVTGQSKDDPLQAFQKSAKRVTTAFSETVEVGGNVAGIFTEIEALNERAVKLYDAQTDKLGEMAEAARQVARETANIIATFSATRALSNGYFDDKRANSVIGKASRVVQSDAQVRLNIGASVINNDVQLRTREAALKMKDGFDAARLAAVDFGERLRKTNEDFTLAFKKLKTSYSSPSSLGSDAFAGIKAGLSGVMDSFGPFALAMMAVGKIMQGLQPVLDTLMAPLTVLGQIIGTMITPMLKLLFTPLKLLGEIVAFLGEIIARVTAAIATAIAAVLKGIGQALNMIPFLHLGSGLIAAGNALSSYAASQYEAADQLKKERKQLADMTWDSAANGVNNLANAANTASDAIINASNTFKLNLAKFNARDYDRTPLNLSGTPGAPVSSSTSPSNGDLLSGLDGKTPVANLMLDGKVLAQVTVDHIRTAASRQYNDASRIKDVVKIGS